MRLGAACVLFALLSACSSETQLGTIEPPKTRIETYSVEIRGAPEGDFTDIAKEALQVYRLKGSGVTSRAFLLRRAKGDVPTLVRLLRSRGYFEGTASAALMPQAKDRAPEIVFTVTPGPRYSLAAHRFVAADGSAIAGLDAAALGSPVGRPAAAAYILSAEDAAVASLRRTGHAYARFVGRDAVADPELKTIEVTSTIDPGRRYRMAAPVYAGVRTVGEEYLDSYRSYKPGAAYDESALRDFQASLQATGLFTAVRIETPETPPADDLLPVTVRVEERKPRTIALGLRYDTADGPEGYARLTHRNLLGRNETATAEIEAGLVVQTFTLRFRKPQFLRNGQALLAGLKLERDTGEAYDGSTAELSFGVERRLSKHWQAGLGTLAESSRIRDQGRTREVVLAGLPGFVAYDSTDDVLDPTRGERLRVEATPFAGRNEPWTVGFVTLDASASTYFALNAKRNLILAFRGRLGSILGAPLARIPSNHRLYSGGGGSVRGYARDLIGNLDRFNSPVGGRSVYELGAELRAPVWRDIGAAVFVEAGSVSPSSLPDFSSPLQLSAGLGLRYASPVGPLRFDVGVPLNPRAGIDDPLQVYLAIGQAF